MSLSLQTWSSLLNPGCKRCLFFAPLSTEPAAPTNHHPPPHSPPKPPTPKHTTPTKLNLPPSPHNSYFSRFALQTVYLRAPQHAKYINAALLDNYYPVGGVRIEDDILVTGDGYEVLTTAPKGEEACRIIRGEMLVGSGMEAGVAGWKEMVDGRVASKLHG